MISLRSSTLLTLFNVTSLNVTGPSLVYELKRTLNVLLPSRGPLCFHQTLVNGSFVFVFAVCLRSGGDRQAKAASKQPADSQPNAGDSAAPRKEAAKCVAAKVPRHRPRCWT